MSSRIRIISIICDLIGRHIPNYQGKIDWTKVSETILSEGIANETTLVLLNQSAILPLLL